MSKEIDYGESVKISGSAPEKYHPGEKGAVCGFRIIQNKREADAVSEPIGTRLWLIELPYGLSFEVPESYLERIE
jgi:hypothetical protein